MESVQAEAWEGPDGSSVHLVVTIGPTPGEDRDLDAASRVRQKTRHRVAALGTEDVVVVLVPKDPADAPADEVEA